MAKMILRARNIRLSLGGRLVLDFEAFTLTQGERVGPVSYTHLLAGADPPALWTIIIKKNARPVKTVYVTLWKTMPPKGG